MQMMHVLHKLTPSTSNLAEGAKGVHWCKETAFLYLFDILFNLFNLYLILRERNQARLELFGKIFLTFQFKVGCIPPPVCLRHPKKDVIYV